MAYVLAHDVVLYRTKDIILAHLVFSFHGCSFICFMKFITPQDNKIQLIQVCTMEFARSVLRFSFHSKWMSAVFFLFTAFIGFLAMVSGFNSISLFLLFIYVAWLMVFCVCVCFLIFFFFFLLPCEIKVQNHYFFSRWILIWWRTYPILRVKWLTTSPS